MGLDTGVFVIAGDRGCTGKAEVVDVGGFPGDVPEG